MTEITSLFATGQMQVIVTLVALDVLLGIIAALIRKDFRFSKLGDFMKVPVLGYILGFAILELVGQAQPSLDYLVSVAYILVVIALLASILGNLGKMGLPMPGVLRKR